MKLKKLTHEQLQGMVQDLLNLGALSTSERHKLIPLEDSRSYDRGDKALITSLHNRYHPINSIRS